MYFTENTYLKWYLSALSTIKMYFKHLRTFYIEMFHKNSGQVTLCCSPPHFRKLTIVKSLASINNVGIESKTLGL